MSIGILTLYLMFRKVTRSKRKVKIIIFLYTRKLLFIFESFSNVSLNSLTRNKSQIKRLLAISYVVDQRLPHITKACTTNMISRFGPTHSPLILSDSINSMNSLSSRPIQVFLPEPDSVTSANIVLNVYQIFRINF